MINSPEDWITPPEVHEDWIDPQTVDGFTLLGVDGNAGCVMAYTVDALREAGNSREVLNAYRTACFSGDYNNLLAVSMAYLGEL
jgi:hypothetical protein